MARDSPVGSPVLSRRTDLNNSYHPLESGLHEQAFQQQILQTWLENHPNSYDHDYLPWPFYFLLSYTLDTKAINCYSLRLNL
uniref:Uncharacterized protein n=1 Tax=Timema shepardi TaxID=629360 RepID=A0A7R9G4X4_TIMSH|nr:unnamed protein product [Timema shepardi]